MPKQSFPSHRQHCVPGVAGWGDNNLSLSVLNLLDPSQAVLLLLLILFLLLLPCLLLLLPPSG